MITKQTAMDIALAYREIETAENLLKEIKEGIEARQIPDVRDVFGRPQGALQLGVPRSETSRTLFDVPWSLAVPVLEAQIADKKAKLLALNEKARAELRQTMGPE